MFPITESKLLFRITLSEEQRSKLLEMCEVLLPFAEFSFQSDYSDIDVVSVNIHEWGKEFDWNSGSFHWYELVMRYITHQLDVLYTNKVLSKYDDGSKPGLPKLTDDIWRRRPFLETWCNANGVCYKTHPIDYAYKRFLELK